MRKIQSSLLIMLIAAFGGSTSSLAQTTVNQGTTGKPRPGQQTPAARQYIVQLGSSFETAEKANELTMKLRARYPGALTQAQNGDGKLYRVRIGPYNNREDARQAANDLTSQGFIGVTILPSSSTQRVPVSDQIETTEPAQTSETDDAMRRTLANLSTQIGALADELKSMRRETERSSSMLELLINEERLAKLEDKIQSAIDYKTQLDAREQEIGRRSRNIQGELVLRGGLRRDEAEAAIRADLQRLLDDVHTQQASYQQRVADLNDQATRLRTRVETLRKKLELLDLKGEKEEK